MASAAQEEVKATRPAPAERRVRARLVRVSHVGFVLQEELQEEEHGFKWVQDGGAARARHSQLCSRHRGEGERLPRKGSSYRLPASLGMQEHILPAGTPLLGPGTRGVRVRSPYVLCVAQESGTDLCCPVYSGSAILPLVVLCLCRVCCNLYTPRATCITNACSFPL